MEQLALQWAWPTRQPGRAEKQGPGEPDGQGEVVLDPRTTEAVIAAMERLLVALVCARKEESDGR